MTTNLRASGTFPQLAIKQMLTQKTGGSIVTITAALARGQRRQRLEGKLSHIASRPGRSVFRFWQEGPGYDRNLNTAKAVLAAIDAIST